MAKKAKPELEKSKLVLIWIPIIVALIGLGGALFAVFYEKPKTFLPNPSLDQAILALVKEDYSEAIAKADEAMVIEPEDPRPYLIKYTALELSDRHDEAVRTLREGTEHVKTRATGGKEIRAVLVAAEISPEEGLSAVVDVCRGKVFNLKTLALRLLEILVKVFEGAERFVRALAEVTEELGLEPGVTIGANATEASRITEAPAAQETTTVDTTTKKQSSKIDIMNYWSGSVTSDSWGLSISASELAGKISLVEIFDDPSLLYAVSRDKQVAKIERINSDAIYALYWNTNEISVYGVMIGDTLTELSLAMSQNGFSKDSRTVGNFHAYFKQGIYLRVGAEIEDGKIERLQITPP